MDGVGPGLAMPCFTMRRAFGPRKARNLTKNTKPAAAFARFARFRGIRDPDLLSTRGQPFSVCKNLTGTPRQVTWYQIRQAGRAGETSRRRDDPDAGGSGLVRRAPVPASPAQREDLAVHAGLPDRAEGRQEGVRWITATKILSTGQKGTRAHSRTRYATPVPVNPASKCAPLRVCENIRLR